MRIILFCMARSPMRNLFGICKICGAPGDVPGRQFTTYGQEVARQLPDAHAAFWAAEVVRYRNWRKAPTIVVCNRASAAILILKRDSLFEAIVNDIGWIAQFA
jgi:hypothetical protein